MITPKFLVTAGNTREKIDQVRDWGNIFTGNTGLSIAKALAAVGPVDLLTSNRTHIAELAAHPVPAGATHPIVASSFTSHAELRGALSAMMARSAYAGIFMTAAVADYRPERTYEVVERRPMPEDPSRESWIVRDVQAGKVKSSHDAIAVLGVRTEKLVDLFRTEWRHAGLLVKFKLEVGIEKEQLLAIGRASRVASGADYLVANTLAMVDGPSAGAYLIDAQSETFIPRADLAARLARLAREWTERHAVR